MCVAIVKPKDKEITDEELKNCFENNPDGAGIAFAKDGKLYLIKGIFDKNKFIEKVRQVENVVDGDMLIHCRISTSGLVDTNNCHPHVVNEKTALIHNGVLHGINVPTDSKVSDTVIFIHEYLKNLPEDFMKDKNIIKLIEAAIGNYNKFCFINNKGETVIVNESEGEWHNGVWYSNDSYSRPKFRYSYSYYDGYYPYNYGTNYYESYNEQNKEPEKITFSKNKIKKLKKKIRNMSDKLMYAIGNFPLYNTEYGVFQEYDEENYDPNTMLMLDEISPDLQEEWDYEFETRFGTYKKAG